MAWPGFDFDKHRCRHPLGCEPVVIRHIHLIAEREPNREKIAVSSLGAFPIRVQHEIADRQAPV
jgi:hypothetical protein